ncbi:hypothetical protein GGR54DRAFT_642406 [Hypoxylon sp. NC1633]|nr:hypothetical protein GGR54DRAFT_642406 [Hypoxylon sp. NC1633]
MAISPSLNIIVVSIVLNVLLIAVVALRFHARRLQKVALGVDGWTILPAAFLALGNGVGNSVGIAAAAGRYGMESLIHSIAARHTMSSTAQKLARGGHVRDPAQILPTSTFASLVPMEIDEQSIIVAAATPTRLDCARNVDVWFYSDTLGEGFRKS